MKVEINYLSIVAIGSFNPDILTPEFLEKYCDVKFEGAPKYKSMPNMVSDIDSGNIKYLMQINRFQITENGLADFNNNQIITIMCKYLEILNYTPIIKIGFNFNLNLFSDKKQEIIKKIYQEKELVKFLDVEKINYNLAKEFLKPEHERFLSLKINIPLGETCGENLYIEDDNTKFIANYNYEFTNEYFKEKFNKNEIIGKYKNRFYEILSYLSGD